MTTTTYDARAALERASARLRSSVREPSRRGVRTAAIVAGVVWTVVMLLRLLLGGVVGMGDDGDGTRLLCEFGVVSNHPWSAEPSAHVYPTYVSHTWYGETCGALFSGEPYYSSQQLVVGLAKALTPVLGLPGALDLRAIGLLLALAFGAIIALLVVLLPGPLWLRLVATGCFGLVMCDSAFADFFISPYSEAAGFIGLLLLCPSLLLLWRRTTASVGGIVLTTAAALFTMTAKPQLLSLLPVTLLALLWRPSVQQKGERQPVSPGENRQQRFTRWLAVRWPALIACVLVCGVAGGFAAAQPKRLNQLVWYDAVFTEMLPNSMDPLGDLRALGADQRLISAMNTTMISGRSAARTPFWDDYKQHVSPARIELHYLENPSRVVAMGSRGVQGMSRLTLHHLGSYPANSGHPQYAKERRIAVVTDIFEWLRDVPALIPLLWLVTIALGAVLASRPWARQPARALGRMTVCVVIALVLQFWTVVMTGGASDLHKHLVFTDFLTALCLPLAALCFVLLFRRAYAAAPEQVQNSG